MTRRRTGMNALGDAAWQPRHRSRVVSTARSGPMQHSRPALQRALSEISASWTRGPAREQIRRLLLPVLLRVDRGSRVMSASSRNGLAEVAAGQISFRYGHFLGSEIEPAAMDRTYWRPSADDLSKSQ
jgi:hypothetical protein